LSRNRVRIIFTIPLTFLITLLSCVRDITCDCNLKKGCRIIYVIESDTFPIIIEKTKVCPVSQYESDKSHNVVVHNLTKKYDSLSILNGKVYSIAVTDSFHLKYLNSIKGAKLYSYTKQGYKCKCYD
jgi:hypothetical protein